jgi:hypothetical protein
MLLAKCLLKVKWGTKKHEFNYFVLYIFCMEKNKPKRQSEKVGKYLIRILE